MALAKRKSDNELMPPPPAHLPSLPGDGNPSVGGIEETVLGSTVRNPYLYNPRIPDNDGLNRCKSDPVPTSCSRDVEEKSEQPEEMDVPVKMHRSL